MDITRSMVPQLRPAVRVQKHFVPQDFTIVRNWDSWHFAQFWPCHTMFSYQLCLNWKHENGFLHSRSSHISSCLDLVRGYLVEFRLQLLKELLLIAWEIISIQRIWALVILIICSNREENVFIFCLRTINGSNRKYCFPWCLASKIS